MVRAESCQNTGWKLKNREDGSDPALYDCVIGGEHVCVTVQDGAARNVTVEARLAFADTFADDKPACVS